MGGSMEDDRQKVFKSRESFVYYPGIRKVSPKDTLNTTRGR